MCKLLVMMRFANISASAIYYTSAIVLLCRKWNGEDHLLANVPLRRYKPLTTGPGSHGDNSVPVATVQS